MRHILVFAVVTLAMLNISCDTTSASPNGQPDISVEDHVAEVDGLASDRVWASAVCPNGDAWFSFALNGGGVSRLSDGQWQTFSTDVGLPKRHVHALACDRFNRVWLGYSINAGGLTVFDGNTATSFSTDDGLTSNYVETISASPNGDLWVGYGNNGRGADRIRIN